MVIAEYRIGNAIVKVNDSFIKSEAESVELINKAAQVIYTALRAQKVAERMRADVEGRYQ